jgi:hypothetical protein
MKADTCVMCGRIIPEGAWVCANCTRQAAPQQICLEYTTSLYTIHTHYLEPANTSTMAKLLHCKGCSCD